MMEYIEKLTPTKYFYQVIEGGITYRMWRGVTSDGIEVNVYVYSTYPREEKDIKPFKESLPPFMSVKQDVSRTYTCDWDE